LEADDGGDAEDIIDAGASGEIGAGFGQAEEDLSVGFGTGEMLD